MKKKFGLSVLIAAIALGAFYLGAKWYATRAVSREIAAAAAKIPQVQAVKYRHLDVALLRPQVTLRSVAVTFRRPVETLFIQRLKVSGFERRAGVPKKLHLVMDGVLLKARQSILQPLRADLEALGYEDLRARLECRYRYDPRSKTLFVEDLSLDVPGMGSATFAARLEHFDIRRLQSGLKNPLMLLTLFPAAAISGGSLTYRDDSLVRRLVSAGAKQAGQPVKIFSRRLGARIARSLDAARHRQAGAAAAAIARFLNDPHRILVRMTAPQPVAFLRLLWVRHPADLIDLFGLQVQS